MDKNSIVGYVLIFVIFAGWLVYSSNKTELEQQEQQQEQLRLDSITQANKIDSLERAAKQPKVQELLNRQYCQRQTLKLIRTQSLE